MQSRNHEAEIGEDFYFISNRFQPYTLSINSNKPVETFNIHIGEQFSEGVLAALIQPADKLLNNGPQAQVPTVAFYNRLCRKDERFMQLVKALRECSLADSLRQMAFEERMEALLVYLLHQHRNVLRQTESLPATKSSTRIELYRRLSIAVDNIHSCTDHNPNLDELAASACLSKFHFLRLFRQAYGRSPYQYMQELRLEKARKLLQNPSVPVHEIALVLGFDNSNSFSRLFRQRTGLYPSQYRLAIN
ncbi:MAG TPA: helix-turn-helix transcriptional regulator [Chitinophagaceae bacterium]|nr:helix-turn-helix transcriptional regulator [Chitinophagaceae bacterium]